MKTYNDLLSMIDNLPDKEDQVTKYIEYLETQEEENFKKLNELEEHFKDIHAVLEGILNKSFLTTDEIEIIEDLDSFFLDFLLSLRAEINTTELFSISLKTEELFKDAKTLSTHIEQLKSDRFDIKILIILQELQKIIENEVYSLIDDSYYLLKEYKKSLSIKYKVIYYNELAR